MGLIADALRLPRLANKAPIIVPQSQGAFGASPPTDYLGYSRAYASNEIVFAAIELLASSAGEPHICGRRWRRNQATIRNEEKRLAAKATRQVNAALVRNGYIEELPDHPLVTLLNAPNPFMSRGQLWGTVVMDRCLAGNAYLLKARGNPPFTQPLELWRLRPDRVKVIPDRDKFIAGYEYNTGTDRVIFPAGDVVHFKTRNPLNDYYGMPPLMPIRGRLDIDEYMKTFLRGFFERGGTGPGSLLVVKNKLSDAGKTEIRERHKKQFGHVTGASEMMILDQTEATYTQFGLNRGLRDALPKELDAMQEARIAMVFGVPGSILGLLIGYESSSYANKRADWAVLWDVTMAPLLSDLDDVLNLSLVPDFGGIDEVYFDLDDIKALQEDVDAVQERERKNFQAGGISFEEFRDAIGRDPNVGEGIFFVPSNLKPTPFEELGAAPEPTPIIAPPIPPALPPGNGATPANVIIKEPRCPSCHRRVGENVQAGASLPCPKCRTYFTVLTTPIS